MGGFLILLDTQGPYDMGDIPPQSELSLQLLPDLWGGGAGEVLSYEIINDGPADWTTNLAFPLLAFPLLNW